MEEFIKDKIFQFYYKKIYGEKSNYQSFKTFTDKDKVSFLINLYLFISNTYDKNKISSNLNNNYELLKKSDNNVNYLINEKEENDVFYQNNYNKIMNDFNSILNKYSNNTNRINAKNDNNNNNYNTKKNNINNNEILMNNKDNTIRYSNNNIEQSYQEKEKDKVNSLKNSNNINSLTNSAYMKYNYNYNSDSGIINDEDNYFEVKKNPKKQIIEIKSKKNDIDITIDKPQLKPGSPLCIIGTDLKNKNINTLLSIQDSNNISNNLLPIYNQSINLNTIDINKENQNATIDINNIGSKTVNKNNIFNKDNTIDNNLFLYKSVPNFNKNLFGVNQNNNKLLVKDLILINQTMTEDSKLPIDEFKNNDNIVERLIKCPQNKYISLNCSEANNLALVIINLMESKNNLENEIEEEKKKNEVRLNKLKLDLDRQKRIIQLNYDKKELNVLDTLNQLKNEIDIEKKFLEDNVKSYNLWDKVTIENQRTKEIKDNINKKLENFKKL